MADDSLRPDPVSSIERRYWEQVADGVLPVQRCRDCETTTHPPRLLCPNCYGEDWSFERTDGAGEVRGYTEIRRPSSDRFADEVPITSAVVELDAGPQVVGIVDEPLESIHVGTRVELVAGERVLTEGRLTFERSPDGGRSTEDPG